MRSINALITTVGNVHTTLIRARPVPFDDFMLFVVLSLFTCGSPNTGRKYSTCVGGARCEKREDNKYRKIMKWHRPDKSKDTVLL